MEEALAWVKRLPNPMPGTEPEIEIRPLSEIEDFAELDPHGRVDRGPTGDPGQAERLLMQPAIVCSEISITKRVPR